MVKISQETAYKLTEALELCLGCDAATASTGFESLTLMRKSDFTKDRNEEKRYQKTCAALRITLNTG